MSQELWSSCEICCTEQPKNHKGRIISVLRSGSHVDEIFFLYTLSVRA